MTTPSPYFAPQRVGETLYELSHLNPLRFQVPGEKLHRLLTVRCRFSNHVFTRAFAEELDLVDTVIIMDGARPRVFCPDRYRLSLHLPDVVLRLCDPRAYVRQTRARRNWLYVATIALTPAGLQVDTEPALPVRYQIFFTLRKAAKTGTEQEDVEMMVESAYAEDPTRPPNLSGRALFVGLVTASIQGRKIHTQPSRMR